MKKLTWKKHHKWVGLIMVFFMMMFCLSGIVLNHRDTFASVNVGRQWLPDAYRFRQWNGGLLRGTLPYIDPDSAERVLIYGNSGLWLTDSRCETIEDFNQGLPHGADYRTIKGAVVTPDGTLWAAGQFALYHFDNQTAAWKEMAVPKEKGERLTDLTLKGDSLIALGRSFLYLSVPPYAQFERLQLSDPVGYNGKVSLFRTVWNLHNGELFGTVGKLVVDAIAIVIIILCITGFLYWMLPKYVKRRKRSGHQVKTSVNVMKKSLNWHDHAGRYTFGLLVFMALTGWCLRPPVLIAIVGAEVPPVPGSAMDSRNAWNDKLRMLKYDEQCGDWLVSTSEGIYAMKTLTAKPCLLYKQPPVSVMGLNAWARNEAGNWLLGSFSGMYEWNRQTGVSCDYYSREIVEAVSGPPFGKLAVSGFSNDMKCGPIVVEYNEGTDRIAMPESMSTLPMSLWNLALEVHVGRIYTILGPVTLIFIFFAGLAALWCIWSGWKVRMPKKKRIKS